MKLPLTLIEILAAVLIIIIIVALIIAVMTGTITEREPLPEFQDRHPFPTQHYDGESVGDQPR